MQVEDYSLGQCIGKGAFGEVYLTTKKGINKLFATKKIPKYKVENPTIKKHLIDEIEILQTLNHKNIIKLETIKQTTNNYYIITEYYNGGGLFNILKQYKKVYHKAFPENIIQHLMRQIIDAIIYLHQRKIIHRDLKLENLLINYESEEDKNNLNLLKAEVKIIDFGFATHLDGSHLRYSILGSPINMDPILLTKLNNQNLSYLIGYDEKADIWSLGTVCYEMATGETLFPVQNINQLVQRVEIGIYHIPIYISQELVFFLERMLQYLGKDRLNAVELSMQPFLTKNVNEFTKIDTTNPNNKFDALGLIVNIKKGSQYGLNMNQLLLPNYNNQNYLQGYNYYANTRPKYYVANMNKQNYGYQYKQAQINNQYQNKYEPVKKINDHQKLIQIKNYNSNPIKINNQNKLNYPSQKQINLINKNLESNKTQEKLKINNKNTNKKNYESNENISPFININNNIDNHNETDIMKNKTEIPSPDLLNQSPFNISNSVPFNYQKINSSFVQSGNNTLYNEFMPKNKMNKSFINKENPLYNKAHFSLIDSRKEISSDVLDNLFDFNIGKELAPEPDIIINNNE